MNIRDLIANHDEFEAQDLLLLAVIKQAIDEKDVEYFNSDTFVTHFDIIENNLDLQVDYKDMRLWALNQIETGERK